ncbi:DUF3883 domain-containing protein [Tenacibaculum aquimarinum]|uniref:DUF3883 domain-containing protein n=1 Tax=Tenacibaculum aquimarinum TaxID=2910675 RepID=UPI001F0B420E|nr:DUF3883 domain-containing protein [Tenacibaculum aquimarinum]MCH3881606.1 DUF3883 domain-containing protein [Tenacibaculum aquimarinum]
MLKELRKYSNFGTPNFYFELLITLNNKKEITWKKSDLEKLFYNRIIDGRSVYDGCIELAIKINILMLDGNKVSINDELSDFLNSVNQVSDKFIEYLFHKLKNDEDFHKIFCSEYLSYDIIYKSLQISNSAFGLKFSNFKQLLIDFGAIKAHPTVEINSYIINSRYKKLFDKTVLPEIKKRKIGVEEFKKAMELQQIYGEEAEKFVVEFENKRLNYIKNIDWVAQYIVNEGYDVASYNNSSDGLQNRFIEVKSYDGDIPYFFWSRNEYKVAKRKKEQYWVYLVNRKQMNIENYQPIMEQNPYENILKNDSWNKEVDKYMIKLNVK